jgi:phage terminase large subunit-like protein
MSLDYAWQNDFTDLTLSFRREEKSYLYWHYSVTRTSVMSLGYAWQDDFTDLTLSFRREEKSYLY